MDNFFPSSFSFNFYTIVLFSAILISILVLVYIGWLMQKQHAGSTFPSGPPITKVSECPDDWTMQDNKYCIIPSQTIDVQEHIIPNTESLYDWKGYLIKYADLHNHCKDRTNPKECAISHWNSIDVINNNGQRQPNQIWDTGTEHPKGRYFPKFINPKPNVGVIYDSSGLHPTFDFIKSMNTSFPNLLFDLTIPTNPIAITNDTYEIEKLFYNNKVGILFSSDPCIKNKWAIKYNVLWDGISNYVSPICSK